MSYYVPIFIVLCSDHYQSPFVSVSLDLKKKKHAVTAHNAESRKSSNFYRFSYQSGDVYRKQDPVKGGKSMIAFVRGPDVYAIELIEHQ